MTSQINKKYVVLFVVWCWEDVVQLFALWIGCLFPQPQSNKMKPRNHPSSKTDWKPIRCKHFVICCANACLWTEIVTSRHPNIQSAQTLTKRDIVFCILQKHPWKQQNMPTTLFLQRLAEHHPPCAHFGYNTVWYVMIQMFVLFCLSMQPSEKKCKHHMN